MNDRKRQNYSALIWRQFQKSRLAVISLFFLVILSLIALFAPLLANDRPILMQLDGTWSAPALLLSPEARGIDFQKLAAERTDAFFLFPPIRYRPTNYDLNSVLSPPSSRHLLGTDGDGRDVAAQLVWGARVSLSVGFVAVGIAVFLGILLGALAGYHGGVIDIVISRLIEVMICFPTFFLILAVLAFVGPSIYNIMIVIGVTGWTGVARLVRGEFFKFRKREFVIAAQALGASDRRIVWKHLLPHSMAPVLISATFGVAGAILAEASLSFLGFGVPPQDPSWGSVLSQAQSYMDVAWWLTLSPGFAIFLTVTAYNLVGEGLRDAVDPKMRT